MSRKYGTTRKESLSKGIKFSWKAGFSFVHLKLCCFTMIVEYDDVSSPKNADEIYL